MGFSDYDDYEYEDDEDFYEYEDDAIDLDDEEDDDDESTFGSSTVGSKIRPFSGDSSPSSGGTSSFRPGGTSSGGSSSPFNRSGGSFGSSSSRSGSTYSSGSRDDLRDRLNKAGDDKSSAAPGFRSGSSGSSFGGSSGSSTGGSSSTGSRPSSSPFNRSSDSSSSSSGSRTPFNRSSTSSTTSGSSSSRLPGGSSSSGSSSSGSSSSPFNRGGSSSSDGGDKKDDKKSSGGLGGFASRLTGGNKDDKSSGDKSSGGGLLGGITSRIGGKDDKTSSSSSARSSAASTSRFGGGSSSSSKDDKSSGSAAAGLLGGITSRFGGGKDDKSSSSSSRSSSSGDKSSGGGFLSKVSSSLPFGGSKDDKSSSSSGGSSSSPFGGRSSTSSASSSASASSSGSSARPSPFGRSRNNNSGSSSSSRSRSNDGGGGGFLGRLFGRGEGQQRSPRPQRGSRVPQTSDADGLTLDNWLDIIGVGMVFGSFVLFFTALSNEQAAISGILEFISDIFGWGALAVPITMFAVGMWLIIRHFGDQAPTVDPIRITGIILGFVTLLVFFQWIDSFSYSSIATLDTQQHLQNLSQRLEVAWNEDHTGGGFVGANLYLTLVANVGEIGAFFLMAFAFIIAGMLMTRLTMSEMLGFAVGMWRSTRDFTRQQAVQQRARRLERQQQRALEAQRPNITVSDLAKPLPQGATNALPSGESDPNPFGQDIRINLGGRSQDTPEPATANANAQSQDSSNGGLFSRFRRGSDTNTNNNDDGNSGSIAAALTGGLIGGIFGGRSDDNQNAEAPSTTNASNPSAAQATPTQGQIPPAQPMATPMQQPGTPVQPAATTSQTNGQPPVQQPMNPAANGNLTPGGAVPTTADNPFGQMQQPQAPANNPQNGQPKPEVLSPATRADRLDEIRMGPSSLSPVIPTQGDVENAVPQTYNPFGRPEDVPTHHTEKLPYNGMQGGQPTQRPQDNTPASRLPSAQPNPNAAQQPQQQRLGVEPTINRPQPVSSPVTNQSRPKPEWRLPDYRTLLSSGSEQEFDRELLLRQARIIEETLDSFGSPGRVVEVNTGPVITQFGVEPDYISSRGGKRQRVKVGAIAGLDRDLQLALGARSIRVEAPVPGKGYVGVEVPNEESSLVSLRDVMESDNFQKLAKKNPLTIALGQSVSGAPVSADLSGMPHLLIAGATGSGKSVCVNSIIASMLAFNDPDSVKFIMVDPKRVELTGYNGIPHLVAPVVTDVERIIGVLKWVTREMDDRYKKFSDSGARNIVDFNKHRDQATVEKMPYIVVIIDELADLMMIAPDETERTITRIAALARATGIHLVIATQRPSVDVVTGLIKANFPARIAFAVSDGTNSRVILDQPGAERLLGKGDMLYMSGNAPAPVRMQGVFVSDMEITNIVRYWKMQAINQPGSVQQITNLGVSAKPDTTTHEVRPRGDRVRQQAFWDAAQGDGSAQQSSQPYRDATTGFNLPDDFGSSDVELDENAITGDTDEDDELYEQAVELVRRLNKASVSLLQRRLRIGYTRAARLIDVMEARGVVGGPKEGSSKPRDVLPV